MESLRFNVQLNQNSKQIDPPQCEALSFAWLTERIEELFPERPRTWALLYMDDEKEAVTVSSDEEFKEACRIALAFDHVDVQKEGFDIYIMPKLSLKDYLEDLSCTVAKLAVAAKDRTIASTSHYAGFGRETLISSATQTKSMIQKSRQEIAVRVSRLQQYLREQRLRFNSRDSMDSTDGSDGFTDKLGDPILKKYPVLSGPNVHADKGFSAKRISKFAQTMPLSKLSPRVKSTNTQNNTQETLTDSNTQANGANSDCDTDAESDDESSKNESTQNLSPDARARNELRKRWRAQVAIVQNIIPQADVDDICRYLTTHNGNVDAVMMALTE